MQYEISPFFMMYKYRYAIFPGFRRVFVKLVAARRNRTLLINAGSKCHRQIAVQGAVADENVIQDKMQDCRFIGKSVFGVRLPMKFKVQKTSVAEFHRQIGIQRAVTDDANCAAELWRQSVIGGLILRGSLPMKPSSKIRCRIAVSSANQCLK